MKMHPTEYQECLLRDEPKMYGIEVGDVWVTEGSRQWPVLVLRVGQTEFSDNFLIDLYTGDRYLPAVDEREHFLKLLFRKGLTDELYRIKDRASF